jgi:L1 cell adhesion molecule like protein
MYTKGFQPACEDWHAKKCLMEVIWNRFDNTKSFMDKGSMAQLRNLIDRRDVSSDSERDFNACNDF